MAEVTATSFDKDVRAAMRGALKGPVIVTDQGESSDVLLSTDMKMVCLPQADMKMVCLPRAHWLRVVGSG